VILDTSPVIEKGLVVKENTTATTLRERPAQGFPTPEEAKNAEENSWEQQTLLRVKKYMLPG